MSYYADQLDIHHRILDEFAEGRSETAQIRRPPQAGVINNLVEVWGVFAPNPSEQQLTTVGLKAPLNGIYYIREVNIPAELGELTKDDSGAMPAGWTMVVRGREMRVTRAIFSDGEVLLGLQDKLEG